MKLFATNVIACAIPVGKCQNLHMTLNIMDRKKQGESMSKFKPDEFFQVLML